jgi:PAS domain S-box-containing protein
MNNDSGPVPEGPASPEDGPSTPLHTEPPATLAGRMARIGTWSMDLPSGDLHWTPEVTAIHELPPGTAPSFDEAIGFFVPEHREAMRAAVSRCLADAAPFDLELRIMTAKGRTRRVRVLGQSDRDAGGQAARLSGAFMDITERSRTEQSQHDLSQRLTRTLDSIDDGFFTLDRNWRYSYLNRRAGEIVGCDSASLLGRVIWEAFPGAAGTAFQRHYERAVAQQQAVDFEEYFAPLDLWLDVVAYPSAEGLTVCFRNISERKRAEAERAELLERERAARREADSARTHYRALFEAMPGLFLVLQPDDLCIVDASEAYLRATRTRRDDIVGRHLFDVFPDDPGDPNADGVRQLRASLERVKLLGQADAMAVQRYPIPVPAELGGGFEERWASAVNSPVLGPDGKVISIIHRVEDVTDYVKHRQQAAMRPEDRLDQMEADILRRSRDLQQLNDHLRAIQRVARIGTWEIELHGDRRMRWSEETSAILGLPHFASGSKFEWFVSLVHPDDRDRFVADGERARHGERTGEIEYRVVRADGEERHLLALTEVLFNAAGVAQKMFGTVQDVSERKAADRRVQAQLSRLELLHRITRAIGDRLELDSILCIVTDQLHKQLPLAFCAIALREADGRHARVASVGLPGRALAAALGLDKEHRLSVTEGSLAECMAGRLAYEPDVAARDTDIHRRLAAANLRSCVLTPLRVEGTVLGVLIGAREPAHGFSAGECDFIAQLAEHVALAMRQAELHGELQTAYDHLRRTQNAALQHERLRAVGEMASGIAHDINNAIAPVSLYAESLLEKEPGLSAGGRRRLEIIQRAIDDVAHTVARLREFYREGEAGLARTLVSMNQMVRQSVELTQARWRAMPQRAGVAIEVSSDLQDGLPGVWASEPEIRDALVNLIFNAVDAMPEGGTLTLRTRSTGQGADARVLIDVQDSGIGMSEETRRRAMEPFFTTKGERGTGLGLAMVYGTMQRHGAEIDIESAPGRGTRVRLSFGTAHRAAPAEAPAARDGGDGPAQKPMRLLVVDDEPAVLASLRDILEMDGHRVDAALGGREGIERFTAAAGQPAAYDAVITDLGMPHVDGREVAAAVKAQSPTTPVIMVTGWGRRMNDDGERPAHVDHIVPKPPNLDQLRAALAHRNSGTAG